MNAPPRFWFALGSFTCVPGVGGAVKKKRARVRVPFLYLADSSFLFFISLIDNFSRSYPPAEGGKNLAERASGFLPDSSVICSLPSEVFVFHGENQKV